MGIHTGEPVVGVERYVGLGVHRAARISAAGHGGQVLVSQTTRELLRDDPLPDVSLRDLGEYHLKDLDEPERIYQLQAPGLASEFPPLKTAAPAPFEGREVDLVEAAQDAVAEMRRPWRRRPRVLAAAGIAAVAAGVVAGVLLVNGGTATALGHVDANAVGVISAKDGTIAAQIPVGAAPSGVAPVRGAAWVANADGNSVSRIDLKTNDVRQTIAVGTGPTGVVAHGRSVWVANGLDGTVSWINVDSSQVVKTVPIGNGPTGVAFGQNAVWVANSVDGTVARLDPVSGRVTRTLPAVVGASSVAVGFNRLWVLSASTGTLVAIDPHTGEVADRVTVGVDPAALAVGAGAVWVVNRADGTLMRIDPNAMAVTNTTPVGLAPISVAAGPGAVWVANAGSGTLSKIDPSSVRITKTIRVGNRPQGLALTRDGVFVAVRSTGQSHRGGTLRVASAFGADYVDPALAYSLDGWSALSLTNDGLVAFRRVGGIEGVQLVPDLAASLPLPTAGGTAYTFRIRPNIHYSNGKLVQPEDFRRELERVFEVQPSSPATQYFVGIVGASRCRPGRPCDLSQGIVTNRVARTITFHLAAPDADFLTKLAMPFAVAVPVNTAGQDIGKHPVPATGPYRIASWVKGRSLRIVRNRSFRAWSTDAQPEGYPDEIDWRVQPKVALRIRAVQGGRSDLARSLDIGGTKQQIDTLATRYPTQLRLSTQAATHYFFLNTRLPPFDDVRVRRAVNYAFDRRAYLRVLGRAFASSCQLVPPNYPSYHRVCPYLPNGPAALAKARNLVHLSGTAGSRVTVWMPDVPAAAARGRFMIATLASLGYHGRLRLVPPGRYFPVVTDSRSRAQTGFSGWIADYPSETGFLKPLFICADFTPASPEQSTDPSEFCDHRIDREIADATAEQAQNPPAATALWQKAERDILSLAPVVPTGNPRNVDFLSRRTGNYQFHPEWGPLLDQLWVR
jgi:YVTN family beta-propeller protein